MSFLGGLLLTNSGPHVTSFTSTETLKQQVYQSFLYQSEKSFSNSEVVGMYTMMDRRSDRSQIHLRTNQLNIISDIINIMMMFDGVNRGCSWSVNGDLFCSVLRHWRRVHGEEIHLSQKQRLQHFFCFRGELMSPRHRFHQLQTQPDKGQGVPYGRSRKPSHDRKRRLTADQTELEVINASA